MHLSRLVVALAAALSIGLGAAIWIVPEAVAGALGLAPVSPAGLVAIRAELGGLFLGLGLACAVALRTRQRPWFLAAAITLLAIAAGRVVGWLAAGALAGGVLSLVVELGVALALFAAARAGQADPVTKPVRSRWPFVLGGLVVVGIAGTAVFLNSVPMMQAVYDRGAERMAAVVNTAPLADDALRVAICGSSAPLPSAARAKACVVVFAGGKFYVVDTGPESTENLVLWGIPLSAVGGVLLTHFHSDHIGDLGELNLQTWAGGRKAPLMVYGGPGVERVVAGFNDAYRMDQGYRTTHHGEAVMPSATWPMVAQVVDLDGPPTPTKSRTAVVFDDGALRITAIEVDHAPIEPAYAYRFDYKGRSVVVSGDLKNHPPLVASARGADILVSEAIAVSQTRSLGAAATSVGRSGTAAIMHDIEDYHITPEQAAVIANEAGVKLLVYYHLLPSPDGLIPRRLFTAGVNDVRPGGWTIADDGSLYTLPIGSEEVVIGRMTD